MHMDMDMDMDMNMDMDRRQCMCMGMCMLMCMHMRGQSATGLAGQSAKPKATRAVTLHHSTPTVIRYYLLGLAC